MSNLYEDQSNERGLNYVILVETVKEKRFWDWACFSSWIALLCYSARRDATDFSSLRETRTYKYSCFLRSVWSRFGGGNFIASTNVFVWAGWWNESRIRVVCTYYGDEVGSPGHCHTQILYPYLSFLWDLELKQRI
jgi:hypothetical protein